MKQRSNELTNGDVNAIRTRKSDLVCLGSVGHFESRGVDSLEGVRSQKGDRDGEGWLRLVEVRWAGGVMKWRRGTNSDWVQIEISKQRRLEEERSVEPEEDGGDEEEITKEETK